MANERFAAYWSKHFGVRLLQQLDGAEALKIYLTSLDGTEAKIYDSLYLPDFHAVESLRQASCLQ